MVSIHAIVFTACLVAGVLGKASTASADVKKNTQAGTTRLSISGSGHSEMVRREITKHEQDALPVTHEAQSELNSADAKLRAEQIKNAHLDKEASHSAQKHEPSPAPAAEGGGHSAAEPLEEMNQVQDDKLLGTDHICGGSGAKLIESYPGPVGRLLVECRQSCMDDAACDYYAYWPEGKDGKNLDGVCKNQCYLYDKCSDSSSSHEAISNADTCTVYLFQLGPATKAARPAYAQPQAQSGAHPSSSINMLFLPVMLLMLGVAS